MNNFTSVGESLTRKDAYSKTHGLTRYIADQNFADLAIMKIKRSPFSHAKIKNISIDYDKLSELKAYVGTAKDIPGKNLVHIILDDMPLLGEEIVRYVGEPVAVVVADSERKANQALECITVNYEPIEAVFDPDEARWHKSIHIYGTDNIANTNQQIKGNLEEGFAKSDIILENEYKTPSQDHAYLENNGVISVPENDGMYTVYFSGQCPFYVQTVVSDVLGITYNNVRIIQATTGGAFGGKEDQPSQLAGLAAFGSYLSGRPVSLIYSREEDIETCSKRHPGIIRIKSGISKTGELLAWDAEFILNTGAYATLGPAVLFRGVLHAVGPYICPNVSVKGYLITTNIVPHGAYRGFGAPQSLFGVEEQIDRLAHAIDMDPVEFRRKNLLKVGDETSFGQYLDHSVGSHETLEKALEQSKWNQSWKKPPTINELKEAIKEDKILKGIGVSTIFYGVGLGAAGKHMSKTGAYVQLYPDGSAIFSVGTTELGQGMITVLSQIVAESLAIPYENVQMNPPDTSRVPDSGPTVASRATTFSGRALQDACRQIKERMVKLSSEILSVPEHQLEIGNYSIYEKTNKQNKISTSEVIKEAYKKRIHMSASGWDVAPDTDWNPDVGVGSPYVIFAWGTNVITVEVDVRTGDVYLKELWTAHDVGKAVNPTTVEGQIEGGSLQGAGYGRFEEVLWDKDGKIMNKNLGTFIIPTTLDSPIIHSIIVEHPYKDGPFGAKGFAEQPLMGIAPAISNAVFNATGVRLNEIPVTPERLWKAIQKTIQKEDK